MKSMIFLAVLSAFPLGSSLHAAESSSTATLTTLGIGDLSPELACGNWIQGEPVTMFDRDHAYLVEFWATWCGPCRATIPHLNQLYRAFKDKNLVVIGQNIWESASEEEVRSLYPLIQPD